MPRVTRHNASVLTHQSLAPNACSRTNRSSWFYLCFPHTLQGAFCFQALFLFFFNQEDLWGHLFLLASPYFSGTYVTCSCRWALFSSHPWEVVTHKKQSSLNRAVSVLKVTYEKSQADSILLHTKRFTYHVTLGYTGNTGNVQAHCNLNRFSCGGKEKLRRV